MTAGRRTLPGEDAIVSRKTADVVAGDTGFLVVGDKVIGVTIGDKISLEGTSPKAPAYVIVKGASELGRGVVDKSGRRRPSLKETPRERVSPQSGDEVFVGFGSGKSSVLLRIVQSVTERLNSLSDDDLTHVDAQQVADRAAALIPRQHPYAELGPFYTTSSLKTWLAISRQALDHKVKARQLLGCATSDRGERVYPVWQFLDDGTTIPHLRQVLDVLHEGLDDPWTWATWLAAEVPDRFGGKAAYRWLREGRDVEPVLDAARRTADRLAH